jgi:tripartite-type tricarboxylate transporter receptor subunit TctC
MRCGTVQDLREAAAALVVIACAPLLSGPVRADDFYQGKTLRIVVGTPTGGGYDAYARLVARHLGNHIPGKPALIVSNMPGASGLKAAAYLYGIAPRDGSVIATFNKAMPLYQALGQLDIPFKTEEMTWIGSVSQSVDVITVWHKTGVKTIADAKRREIIMGADSSTGTMATFPLLLNATLGTRFKVVTGYAGSSAVNYAMEQGEVEGRGSNPWSSWKATRPDWVRQGLITPLVQVGLKKDADLAHVPLLNDLTKNDAHKAMFRLMSAPIAIERPFVGPPGLAREPRDILRRAFEHMGKDPAFLAEAARASMEIDPRRGEEVERIVADIVGTPPTITQSVREIIAKDADGRSGERAGKRME